MNREQALLEIKNVRKSFGHVEALKGVSFSVYPGEVVGLLGDNGAGKSTLIKSIMGVHHPDSGSIKFKGQEITSLSSREIRMLGIEAVPQGGAVVQFMNISRNLFLGREPQKSLGFLKVLDHAKMERETKKVITGIGVRLRSTRGRASALSGGERQAISIGRVLFFQSSLILLDEPTQNLSVRETDKLLQSISEIKQHNIGVIFVTHNVYHVYQVADKFVILSRGNMVGIYRKENTSAEEIIDIIRTGGVESEGAAQASM